MDQDILNGVLPESPLQALLTRTAPPAKPPTLREKIASFTGDLMFTLGESLKASAQYPGKRGERAGQAAAFQAPFVLKEMRRAEEEKRKQEELAKATALHNIGQQNFENIIKRGQLKVQQDEQSRLSQPKPPEPPSDYTIGNTRYSGLTNKPIATNEPPPKPPDLTPEEKFIELTLAEKAANNGGTLSRIQEIAARQEAKQEWSKAGREDNTELDEIRLRQAELAVQLAEQRLKTTQATGLSSSQQTQVLRLGSQFDTNAITKKYNIVAEATQFANSIDPKTKNPADHIALVYAFAKAMDPDSVVREGEYATVKKYAQSWLQQFGFDALRVVDNQGFLTETAMKNLQSTITSRAKPVVQQYQNLRQETIRKMNVVTGGSNGGDYLIDYGGAFPSPPPADTSGWKILSVK